MNKPTATGNLAATPFCELLVYALGQALSGSLVLECPDRSKHAVLFHQGAPVKARVDHPEVRLGARLVARGLIDARARSSAEAGDESILFGQRLVGLGLLSADALDAALDEQLHEQLAWLARVPGPTVFAYYAGADLLATWGGEHRRLDPLAGIWHAIDVSAPPERVAQACRGFGARVLRLHPASRIGRFGFGARERAALDVLRVKPQPLSELLATGLLEPAALQRVLYALTLTRHLDTGELPLGVASGTRPAAPASSGKSPAVRRLSSTAQPGAAAPVAAPPAPGAGDAEAPPGCDEPAARRELSQTGRFASRQEIESRHRELDRLDHYALLDVERTASNEQIGAAFAALVRRWHPDRLNPDLADLKEVTMRVFARMTEAHRTLSHPNNRKEYDQLLGNADGEDSEQAQVQRVLRAAESFQKAEILIRKRDLDGAERFAALALAGDGDQPEYAALHAWIRARKPGVTESQVAASIDTLEQAIAKQPNNVKMRYYHGCVLKLAGRDSAAMREFRFVAEHDPSNLDAARELRLHQIRRNTSVPAPSEGLFGRLFKR